MLPIFKKPMRLICRSHLLLTTALISLAPLPFGADVAQAQMYLDNADPGGPGPDYQTEDGNWQSGSLIWNDGTGTMGALPGDEIGVLTGSGPITLDVGGPGVGNSDVQAGGLRVDSGDFTLRYGQLLSGATDGSLSFLVAVGSTLEMRTDVAATSNINILSTGAPNKAAGLLTFSGHTSGTLNNAGVVMYAGAHSGNVVNNNSFHHAGYITGDLTNNFEADPDAPGNTVTLDGDVGGTLTNYDIVTTGTTDSTLGGLINAATGAVIVGNDDTLTVSSTVANSGAIYLDGGTLNGNVNTLAGGRINMTQNTEQATIIGNLVNAGTLQGTGEINGDLTNSATANFGGEVQGALTNSGQFQTTGDLDAASLANNAGTFTVNAGHRMEVSALDAMTNAATLNINGTLDGFGTASNTGIINLAGRLEAGLANGSAAAVGTGTLNMTSDDAFISSHVSNYGTANIRGDIDGTLTNHNIAQTAGNVEVARLITGVGGNTTINQTHTMTSTLTAVNYGTTTIAGTLNGNIVNTVDTTTPGAVPGTLALAGGVIAGAVTNSGTMNARGTVTGQLTNSNTLNTTGNLSVGTLTNNGTTNVVAGHLLHSTGAIDNGGQMNVAGDISLAGISRLTNTGTLTMNGGDITGAVTNDGTMNVNADTEIIGSLINTSDGELTLNSPAATGADITLTIANSFTNYGTVDGTGTGALTIATGTYINAGGTVSNVNVVGNLQNEAVLTYDQDAFLNGSLTNTSTGDVTVSAALDMNNNNVTNRGDFIVTTDLNSAGDMHSVRTLLNESEFEITTGGTVSANLVENRNGGNMVVGGTLNSATQVNNTGATLTVSGVVDADGGIVNRSSGTQTGQITMAGGTLDGVVTNHANLGGNGTVTGVVTNYGNVTPTGTLQVAGLINNEIVDIAAASVLRSTANVQNHDRLNVAGRLEAGLNNHASTTLAGGTIAGAVTNQRNASLTGTGTIAGTLLNGGAATIGGQVTGQVTNTGNLTSAGTLNVAGLTNDNKL